jgi:hypothetical protein
MNNKLIIYLLFILLLSGYIIYFIISYLNTKKKQKDNLKKQKHKINQIDQKNNILEYFYDNEADEFLNKSGNYGEISGQCKSVSDISEICKNENCCANNPNNCYCKNKKVKSCRKLYNKCLNDEYYNINTLNYFDINKSKACKNILDNCCDYVKEDINSSTTSNNFSKTKSNLSTGTIKETNNATICNMNLNNVNECKNICNDLDDCKTFKYNNVSGTCDFYNKYFENIINEAYAASENTISFYEKDELDDNKNKNNNNAKFIESFTNKNNYKQVCKNYSNSCNNNKENSCKCSNKIVQNCHNQFKDCLNDTENNFNNKEKYCSTIFGECCAVLDNIKLSDKFKYSEPEIGVPSNNNLLCDISKSVLSLDECKNECSLNEECSFIDTNLKYIIENDNKLLTPKCKLYKGTYSKNQSVNEISSNYKNNLNRPTIYSKKKLKNDIDKMNNELNEMNKKTK